MNKFDLIIIGGGASGIMAAISAKKSHPNFDIAILDRSFALGRKILVCGAGRCNITNVNLKNNISGHYYGAKSEFINSIFEQFGYEDIIKFFEDLGINLYTERKTDIGKIFPTTDQAKTVTSLLEDELENLGIKIFLNTHVDSITKDKNFSLNCRKVENNILSDQKIHFESEFLIISAGGRTYPALGSDGSGYSLAKSFGHNVIQGVPSAVPLEGKNLLSQALQGVKMEIEVTSFVDGEKPKSSIDDVMFTHYGLSGPAILNISREISIHINRNKKNNAYVMLNFFPKMTEEDLMEFLVQRWQKRPNQTLEKSLFGIFPNKIPEAILKILEIDKNKKVRELDNQTVQKICTNLTSYKINITGTKSWNEAEFTAGGVDSLEIKEKTLESKIVSKLYFCGEILDVDGDVGGYNLSWAWSSGAVAGKLS